MSWITVNEVGTGLESVVELGRGQQHSGTLGCVRRKGSLGNDDEGSDDDGEEGASDSNNGSDDSDEGIDHGDDDGDEGDGGGDDD